MFYLKYVNVNCVVDSYSIKRPAEVFKPSRKDVHRVASLGRLQNVDFEHKRKMHFCGTISSFILSNVCIR